MKRFRKILVATDSRLDKHPVLNAAAEVAIHNEASLQVVDVVPDFSWAARLAIQDHEHLQTLMRQEKREQLEALAAPLRDRGVEVHTKLLEGKTSVEIVREVIRGEHDLVMAVSKGDHSRHRSFFGHTARRLLRHCPAVTWLVAADAVSQVRHVLACVDTSSDHPLDAELNEKVYELASSIHIFQASKFSVLHAWSIQEESTLRSRLKPETLAEYERNERTHREKLLDTFLHQYESSDTSAHVHLIKGKTSEVVGNFVRDNAVDLVVMGTVARSGLIGLVIGNTSETILDLLHCSVLAVKPYQFKSPIQL
ncbi:Universal stress protein E [Novipirellula galeiformis]|uniref:Universal stress protein E n=1 Tax=Novipirellula galeiformis TaxID=2528004 RepID=A0A5C6C9U2_9BACT|nr:universal stress protein [Novipirellula galeiformis]TWU20958.1 Universal stress protein E [Novipirellula galeiformis]